MPEQPDYVDVPEEFRAIGYSGLFWLDIPVTGGGSALNALARKAPFLSPTRGWMILRVNHEDQTVTAVCKDDLAVWMVVTKRPPPGH